MTPAVYARPRRELPSIRIVQVVHAIDDGSTAEARALAKSVVARLLDSGNPALQVKEPGGNGPDRQQARCRKAPCLFRLGECRVASKTEPSVSCH
jgi:hypothetical protein